MNAPPLFHLTQGSSCLVVNVPHAGTYIPPNIAKTLTQTGRAVVDTDWHVDRLVEFVTGQNATLLVASHSRTVVDLNRAAEGGLLYPGQVETSLCPTESFDGDPLYSSVLPTGDEIEERTTLYWRPYHAALEAELTRIKAIHGTVRLLDMHSIRGRVPRLFEGRLPDLNIGTNSGASADPALVARVVDAGRAHRDFSLVLDGRFKGGAITRSYGRPEDGMHAIQIEIVQEAYMDEADTQHFDPHRAAPLMLALANMVKEASSF